MLCQIKDPYGLQMWSTFKVRHKTNLPIFFKIICTFYDPIKYKNIKNGQYFFDFHALKKILLKKWGRALSHFEGKAFFDNFYALLILLRQNRESQVFKS